MKQFIALILVVALIGCATSTSPSRLAEGNQASEAPSPANANPKAIAAETPKQDSQTSEGQRPAAREVEIGKEFPIKTILGDDTTVSVIEKAGRYFIRSEYVHGWTH